MKAVMLLLIVILMEAFNRFLAKIVHFVTTRQLDYFVSRNKKVFEELAKE